MSIHSDNIKLTVFLTNDSGQDYYKVVLTLKVRIEFSVGFNNRISPLSKEKVWRRILYSIARSEFLPTLDSCQRRGETVVSLKSSVHSGLWSREEKTEGMP